MAKKKKYQRLDVVPTPDSVPRKRKRKPKSKQRQLRPIYLMVVALAALLILAGIFALLLVPIPNTSPDMPLPTLVSISATPVFTGEYIEDLAQNDDLLIAAGSNTLRLYENENNQLVRLFDDYNFSNPMHENRVSVAFRPGSNQFASLTSRRTADKPNAELTIWGLNSGNIITRKLAHEGGFSNHYWGVAVTYSPDGRWLATGAGDATIALWDAETGDLIRRIDADFVTGVRALSFDADRNRLMATIYTGSDYSSNHRGAGIHVWDIHDLQNPERVFSQPLHVSELHWTAFSPDGRYFAATMDRNMENYDIVIWNMESLSLERTIALPHDSLGSAIISIAFSPDNTQLAFVHHRLLQASTGPGIPVIEEINPKVYDWRTGEATAIGPALGMKGAYELRFSPDGKILLYVDANDNNLHRWHIGTEVVEMLSF